MKFKSWKDQYKFIEEYATASCIDCFYGGEIKESEDDGDYKRLFCTRHIAMVEFAFQFLCTEWEDKESRKDLNQSFDEDTGLFKISDELLQELDDNNIEWTFDEIKERINEEIKK